MSEPKAREKLECPLFLWLLAFQLSLAEETGDFQTPCRQTGDAAPNAELINVTHHAGVVRLSLALAQSLLANPAAEYRPRSAQLESAFGIALHVRIFRTTGA
jgi:hypothetical protein